MTTPYTLPLYLFGREREFQRVGMSDCYQLVIGGELCKVERNDEEAWIAEYANKRAAYHMSPQVACEALENELVPLATVLAGIAGRAGQ